MLLVTFIADICPRCGSLNEIENGEQRLWCPDCGGQPLMYEQLVECEECTGDGSCLTCKGTGHARA
jgi:hypothetical protein